MRKFLFAGFIATLALVAFSPEQATARPFRGFVSVGFGTPYYWGPGYGYYGSFYYPGYTSYYYGPRYYVAPYYGFTTFYGGPRWHHRHHHGWHHRHHHRWHHRHHHRW